MALIPNVGSFFCAEEALEAGRTMKSVLGQDVGGHELFLLKYAAASGTCSNTFGAVLAFEETP